MANEKRYFAYDITYIYRPSHVYSRRAVFRYGLQ